MYKELVDLNKNFAFRNNKFFFGGKKKGGKKEEKVIYSLLLFVGMSEYVCMCVGGYVGV